jgi:hypothetical protein
VNQALHALEQAQLIRVEYGGVRVLDLEALRRYTTASDSADRAPRGSVADPALMLGEAGT